MNCVTAGRVHRQRCTGDGSGLPRRPAGTGLQGNGAIHSVHADHLNTPRVLVNENGNTVWRWDSDAYGTTPAHEDPDGNGVSVTLNWRFPGQSFDADTGLHYNYFRDYDPVTGRYIESDPIGLRGGINTYGYDLAPKFRTPG